MMADQLLRYSSWYRLKRSLAWFLKFKDYLLKMDVKNSLTVSDLERAECAIIHCVQQEVFEKEINVLRNKKKCLFKFAAETKSMLVSRYSLCW